LSNAENSSSSYLTITALTSDSRGERKKKKPLATTITGSKPIIQHKVNSLKGSGKKSMASNSLSV